MVSVKQFPLSCPEKLFHACQRPCLSTLKVGGGGGGGGGNLVFSNIRRLWSFFGVQILNFIIFGAFRKKNIFGDTKILWIFSWGHHKIGLYLR